MIVRLHNGNAISAPAVWPVNWEKCSESGLKKSWRITYRFYDKSGQSKRRKIESFAEYKTLEQRREAIRVTLKEIYYLHDVEGLNLITGDYEPPVFSDPGQVGPDTLIIQALDWALTQLKYEPKYLHDCKLKLAYIKQSILRLRFFDVRVRDFTRKYCRATLEGLDAVKGKPVSAYTFNAYRKVLAALFTTLIQVEAVEVHPVRDILKRKDTQRIREVMTMDERRAVNIYLRDNHYTFWRYVQIFFHSGRRSAELLLIKREDVDLQKQIFKIVEKKGRSYREKIGVIKDIALPLWVEVMEEAKPGQYLFGRYLKPSDAAIDYSQIGKRWKKLVQKPLGIKASFYSLKHSNADDIARLHGLSAAQGFIGHSSDKTTAIYTTGEAGRRAEVFRRLDNSFENG